MLGLGKRTVRILTIDGGGIRGLIPSLIIEEIAKRLHMLGRARPMYQVFDLIAGTSAGGVIALGLTLPRTPEDEPGPAGDEAALRPEQLSALFSDRGMEIFPQGRFPNLRSIVQAFGDKYSASALETVARSVFADATVADALTNIVVTSYDAEKREPHLFKSYARAQDEKTLNFYMRDAVRATTAAPTFFAPAWIQSIPPDGKRYCLIDGGMFANNPAMIAYFEARKLYPHARRFIIVSLGTGATRRHFTYDDIKSWGYLEWVNPAIGVQIYSMSSDGQSRAVLHQLAHIPEVRLYRFNATLNERCSEAIDDVSSDNMAGLTEVADLIIRENSSRITELCRRL